MKASIHILSIVLFSALAVSCGGRKWKGVIDDARVRKYSPRFSENSEK